MGGEHFEILLGKSSSSPPRLPPPAPHDAMAASAAAAGAAGASGRNMRQRPTPPLEVAAYAAVTGAAALRLYTSAVAVSREYAASGLARDLTPGWLLPGAGWREDASDAQWRDFRAAVPQLGAAMAAFVVLSRAARAAGPGVHLAYYVAFSLALLVGLHGAQSLFVLALLGGNYLLATRTAGSRGCLPAVWSLNIAAFLAARSCDGWPLETLPGGAGDALAALFGPLARGPLRWHIHYNLLMLRMISYAADLHWAACRRPARGGKAGAGALAAPAADTPERERIEGHLPRAAYGLASYLAYTLYPPLYVAGPTMTFNAWASQHAAPPSAVTRKQARARGRRARPLAAACCRHGGLLRAAAAKCLHCFSVPPLRCQRHSPPSL